MTAWIAVGLVVYAAIWLTVGFAVGVRRHRDPVARYDAATAMRNAPPQDVPAETARLDNTTPDLTLALPDLNNETIAIGAPPAVSVAEMAGAFQGGPDSVTWLQEQRAGGATTEPAETLGLPAGAPTSLAAWEPPEPRVVLTVAWHPPDGLPQWDRYDLTEPVAMPNNQTAGEGELGVKSMWQILTHQRLEYGGTVKVAVYADGHLVRQWEDADWDVWTDEAVPVIRDARKALERV